MNRKREVMKKMGDRNFHKDLLPIFAIIKFISENAILFCFLF